MKMVNMLQSDWSGLSYIRLRNSLLQDMLVESVTKGDWTYEENMVEELDQRDRVPVLQSSTTRRAPSTIWRSAISMLGPELVQMC